MSELPAKHRIHEGQQQKLCSTCKKWIPLMGKESSPNFSKRNVSKDGLSYSCKSCERATASKSYKGVKTRKKERQRYEANREHVLERSKKHYIANREARLDQNKLYRLAHPEIFRTADARRRKRLKGAKTDGVTRAEIIARDSIPITLDGVTIMVPICQICMEPVLDLSILDIDHIVPLSVGGDDTAENKRVTHHVCNIKRTRDGRDLRGSQTD